MSNTEISKKSLSSTWHADPLIWGEGPGLLEVFLEPTCPFSVKTFCKLDEFIQLAWGRARIQIWLQSQPWHLLSPIVSRAVLAASTLEGGRDTARQVMNAVAQYREAFVFEDHCRGPNRDRTPNQLLQQLETWSGVVLTRTFEMSDLDREIKRHARYARQNGIHASPTFMVNGLVDPSLGSADDPARWAKAFA